MKFKGQAAAFLVAAAAAMLALGALAVLLTDCAGAEEWTEVDAGELDTDSETDTGDAGPDCLAECDYFGSPGIDLSNPTDLAGLRECIQADGNPDIFVLDAAAIGNAIPPLGCLEVVNGGVFLGPSGSLSDVSRLYGLHIDVLEVYGLPDLDPCPLIEAVLTGGLDVDLPCIYDNGASLGAPACPQSEILTGC